MRNFALTTILLCVLSGAAATAVPVTVLGLPLGGKMQPTVRKCAQAPPHRNAPICWVHSRKGYKGTTGGSLHLPDSVARPAWAAYATFGAHVDREGILTDFTVESSARYEPEKIIESISARFGRPNDSEPVGLYKAHASWIRPEIEVSMLCDATRCFTHFRSAAMAAEGRKRAAEAARRGAIRPIMP